MFSKVDAKLKGLHPLPQPDDTPKTVKHLLVSTKGHILVDSIGAKKHPKKHALSRVNGDSVWKSVQSDFDQNVVAICQQRTTLQLWNVNNSAVSWQAKNLPHDELELAVPIFDTGVAFLGDRCLAVCNGYGQLRQYDIRASRKITSNATITKNDMMLTHVAKSRINENHLYVITQEGHPLLLDRRYECRVVRKMPGAKGSVRDCKVLAASETDLVPDSNELLLTVGCDRHIRVFDPKQKIQNDTSCGAAYLKQKLNCILFR